MTTLPFKAPKRSGDAWFLVGYASSFPDIKESGTVTLSESRPCGSQGSGDDDNVSKPSCKVFLPPDADAQTSNPAQELVNYDDQVAEGLRKGDQVLVFQYMGRFHAIDNKCPHSSYPLSNGVPFDIEDFGIVLSAGITCPKHGWSFDLWTGNSDRGNYQLKRWEVQLRPATDITEDEDRREVWVRRRQRMG